MTAGITIAGERRSVVISGESRAVVTDDISRVLTVDASRSDITVIGGTRTITVESSGGPAGPPGKDAPPSFETFAKNLHAYPASFGYAVDGTLETVTFATPSGTVTKTLGYASGRLTTITLSGAIPSGIDTVKALVYAGDSLASVSYS